jgi:hypothetical protein
MKTLIKYTSFLLTLILFAFYSCDYVSNPYAPQTTGTTGTTGGAAVVRKIFVEDYTGHKCDNCPRAARTAHDLKDQYYQDNMVIVSIHAGSFAYTTPLATGEQFPTDMRCPTGNTYYNNTDFSVGFNPFFMVNRKDVPTANNYVSETALSSSFAAANSLAPDFKMEITNNYTSATRNLNTKVKVTALNALSGTYKLVILLTEDSVIAEQLDKYVTPNYVPNYVHRDVLRGAINSDWGSQVFSSVISVNAMDSVIVPSFAINSAYNENHCAVVAYIYDANSASPRYYEVMQAEEVRIK